MTQIETKTAAGTRASHNGGTTRTAYCIVVVWL